MGRLILGGSHRPEVDCVTHDTLIEATHSWLASLRLRVQFFTAEIRTVRSSTSSKPPCRRTPPSGQPILNEG